MLVARGLARKVGRALGFGAVALVRDETQAVAGAAFLSAPAPVAGNAPASVALAPEFAGRRVLIADDSEINRTILRTFLERLGFEVTLAADGAEGLERWLPVHDLVCLDIEMPKLDGVTLLSRIRNAAVDAGAPPPMALAVTVNALTQEVTEYMQAGFDACLPKPFSRSDLVEILRRRWPATA